MVQNKKTTIKKAPGKPGPKPKSLEVTNGIQLMTIENGVPIPPRGVRDPAFVEKAMNILGLIKPKQSFVVEKNKLHSVQKLTKENFESYKIKSSVILPEKKFVRVWRDA